MKKIFKGIWSRIVLFLEELKRHEQIADDIVESLKREPEFWTELEGGSVPRSKIMRFEKKGPYSGTKVTFDVVSTTVEIGEEKHIFWLEQSFRFHKAAFPEIYKETPESIALSNMDRASMDRNF